MLDPPQGNDTTLDPPLSSQGPLCYLRYTLDTSISTSSLEIEQLPVIDVLPWLPLCEHVTCELRVGPLCFREDSRLFGGG